MLPIQEIQVSTQSQPVPSHCLAYGSAANQHVPADPAAPERIKDTTMHVNAQRRFISIATVFLAFASFASVSMLAHAQVRPSLSDLAEHLPRAITVPSDGIWIIAPLPSGLGVRRWSNTGGWAGGWNANAPGPTGIAITDWSKSFVATYADDPTLIVGGLRRGPQVNAVFSFINNARTAIGVEVGQWDKRPFGPQWLYSHSTVSPPSPLLNNSFRAASGFGWHDTGSARMNVFGLSHYLPDVNNDPNTLREMYWDGSRWAFIDHGRPTQNQYDKVLIGPNSTVWDNRQKAGFVFVALRQAVPLSGAAPNLWLRQFGPAPNSNWRWIDLGTPYAIGATSDCNNQLPICSRGMEAPLAIARYEGTTLKIHVFTLVLRQIKRPATRQWILWERHFDGNQWRPWVEHGPFPGNFPVSAQPSDPLGPPFPPFKLTSGVVYKQNSTLKINLFGPTLGGRLMEYFWTGQKWQYGFNVVGPGGKYFNTISSAVHDGPNFDFITVVGRVQGAGGTRGEIWEYYWDSRINQNWAWRRLFP